MVAAEIVSSHTMSMTSIPGPAEHTIGTVALLVGTHKGVAHSRQIAVSGKSASAAGKSV